MWWSDIPIEKQGRLSNATISGGLIFYSPSFRPEAALLLVTSLCNLLTVSWLLSRVTITGFPLLAA